MAAVQAPGFAFYCLTANATPQENWKPRPRFGYRAFLSASIVGCLTVQSMAAAAAAAATADVDVDVDAEAKAKAKVVEAQSAHEVASRQERSKKQQQRQMCE
ncbi:hypothetical protein AWZ03_009670 [Drosophila navojoa]|uniref:Uncharacterized protein n=1 Tax=Drosophila navojoa TaxID=7232 RepID=A0A484B7W2_DRONA|nr:hypothetical protein AWZ03_009670 [Drosophila navojoa]